MDLLVRAATTDDAAEIARLSGELGYPGTPQEMAARLEQMVSQGHFVAVAVQDEPSLSGWIAAESRVSLEVGRKAEITGLVVDVRARRSGVGARLVAAVEQWARENGHDAVVVRSSAARTESHLFYPRHGYARYKTQHVYSKPLAG